MLSSIGAKVQTEVALVHNSVPHMKVEQIGIRNLRFNVFVAAHIAMQLTNLSNLKKNISDLGHICLLCQCSLIDLFI